MSLTGASVALANTRQSYGSIAKYLHWVTAAFLAVSYVAIYYREWLARGEFENWVAIQLHMSLGLSLGAMVVVRLLWRLSNQVPEPNVESRTALMALKLGHLLLYAVMVVMPLTGFFSIADYLVTGGGVINVFFVYDLNLSLDLKEMSSFAGFLDGLEQPAEQVHRFVGTWVMSVLIVGHAIAALYHHVVKNDDTLTRMTTG